MQEIYETKQRIIQETVPGKQITLAHIIANPDTTLYRKLGLDPTVDYTNKSAIGILTMTPSEYAIIAAVCANIVTIIALVVLLLVVKDFTSKYNVRTNKWLDTIMALVNRTEVTDGYTEILQQLPPP